MGRKQKIAAADPRPTSVPDPPPADNRPWADLPEPILVSILDLLLSAADFLAFAATCRLWRSSSHRGPPILLSPLVTITYNCSSVRWRGPRRHCRLQTLTPTLASKKSLLSPQTLASKISLLSPQTLARPYIGCSHGHLILLGPLGPTGHTVLLANAFTGRRFQSPPSPLGKSSFSSGILTAPPSSPSSLLLLVADSPTMNGASSVLCWPVSDGKKKKKEKNQWSVLELIDSRHVRSLVVSKGQIFGLDYFMRLVSIEFDQEMKMSCRVIVAELSARKLLYAFFYKSLHLVECDGELLAVLFAPADGYEIPDEAAPVIEVYWLDLERSAWVKKEGLGDWCVFIDVVGGCPYVCRDPGRWGGRSNCVYLAGTGCDGCSVFPVDGKEIDRCAESPLNLQYVVLPKWPSPVWVYPSLQAS